MCKEKHGHSYKTKRRGHVLQYGDLIWDNDYHARLHLYNGLTLKITLDERRRFETAKVYDGFPEWTNSEFIQDLIPETQKLYDKLHETADAMFMSDVIRMIQERSDEVVKRLKKYPEE